jgi:Zn-dependent protease
LTTFGLALVPALFGIICHEVAHGWAAYRLGDPTARHLGRLTLNPVRHIDPMGLGVFAVTAVLMPFAIGWAKPVPVQPRYFKRPREGMVLVALAGPAASLLVALACAIIVKLSLNVVRSGMLASSLPLKIILSSATLGIGINCALALFNLMPIPPLDGSHVVSGFLPPSVAAGYQSLGRYGMLIIMLLLASGGFERLLIPSIDTTAKFIMSFVGVL